MNERVLVTGAGGFLGTHLTRRLKELGYWVRGVDLKKPQWSESEADEFWGSDLRQSDNALLSCLGTDWVFHLAATMGGMGFISTQHAEILKDNTLIDINVLEAARRADAKRLLFTSSVCIYNYTLLNKAERPLVEADAYPANPQESYGWEKLHTEHVCRSYKETGWLDTCIVRLNNTYGPLCAYEGGREKAPAALCRKVAEAKRDGRGWIEVWGDGRQLRPFMYVDDCVDGLLKAMRRNFAGPVHIGPEQEVTIDDMADVIAGIADWPVEKRHVPGPEGHRRRLFDYSLCRKALGWQPSILIEEGLVPTYEWIEERVNEKHSR